MRLDAILLWILLLRIHSLRRKEAYPFVTFLIGIINNRASEIWKYMKLKPKAGLLQFFVWDSEL